MILFFTLTFGLIIPSSAKRIIILGDSISAGYGLETEEGWVHLLKERLEARASEEKGSIINASLSGETTAGGLTRLPALLDEHQPDIVIIELGGNDGLRGLPLSEMKRNLAKMIDLIEEQNGTPLLLGMMLPPNYGPRYTEKFHAIYHELAKEKGVTLLPFFLESVGGVDGMMQEDGIHPTKEAQPILLENLWPYLNELL